MISLQFLLTSLVIVLIPGTGVLYTISTGLTKGRRASIFAAIGCTAGILPHLLATILGLAALLHASALAFQTLKYAGVAYLLYLAYGTWKDRSSFTMDAAPSAAPACSIVVKAILLNVLNPKLTIFFLAFLPQFVDPDAAAPMGQLLLLSGIFMLMTLVIFIAYGLLANAFRKAVGESVRAQAWMRRGFAATFAGLAANLACANR
ncbi:MAG: LysE family translocator [Desulfobulbus sp.]